MEFGSGTPQRVEVHSGVHMENATGAYPACITFVKVTQKSLQILSALRGWSPGCECAGAVTGIERQSKARETWSERHQRDTRLPPELTGSSDSGGGVLGKGVRWEIGRGQQTSQARRHLIDRYVPRIGKFPRETYEQRMQRSAEIENWTNGIYRPAPSDYRPNVSEDGYKLGKPKKTFLPSTSRFTPSDNLLKGGRPSTAYDMLDSSPSSNWKQPLYAPSVKKCTPPDSPSFRNSRSTLVDGLARGTFNDSPCPFPLHKAVPQPPPDYEPFNFSLAHTITFICHQGASFPHRADPCITLTHGHSLMKPSSAPLFYVPLEHLLSSSVLKVPKSSPNSS
ncbi:hypothetical protein D9758_015249 [Tetrapyrgos nigripes]|uniref:Uncharacterized protein n=1 Tax=Tetrapyrgos nigripes TaxID=182062 RepID=A0A8H5FEH5_9AGAR|nr:hypothetical protein D9758_015249 [Tetrapyrgos nigripes]